MMTPNNENQALIDAQTFNELKELSGFEVNACVTNYDFEDKTRFKKLSLTPAQKMQLSALAQQIPVAAAAGTLAKAYSVSFPAGLPHTLTALKQGGVGSMIRMNGKFAGSASFYELSAQGAVLGAFSIMSIVTGQYFLTQINKELNMMNLKVDKILEFLYGDKKAELMAEVSFVQYAYQNYASIMAHEQQRIATLISLQEAKKIAMKDIEFYLGDLESTVTTEAKKYAEFDQLVRKAYQIRDSLSLSTQLYVMSSMLELHYAENYDTAYMENIKNTAKVYIGKCDQRTLSGLSILKNRVAEYKLSLADKVEKVDTVDKKLHEQKLSAFIDVLSCGEEPAMYKTLVTALDSVTQRAEYFITAEGDMYVRAS